VIDVYTLKQSILVELDTGVHQEYPHADIQPWDELEVLRRKSEAPCDKHDGGECDCGKEKPPTAEKPSDESKGPERFQGKKKNK
jgi:hypothetical protein